MVVVIKYYGLGGCTDCRIVPLFSSLMIKKFIVGMTQVAAVRPIPFSEYSVLFELQDGRVRNCCINTVLLLVANIIEFTLEYGLMRGYCTNEQLAELRRPDETGKWEWARIIGTPTSTCLTTYWTAVAT